MWGVLCNHNRMTHEDQSVNGILAGRIASLMLALVLCLVGSQVSATPFEDGKAAYIRQDFHTAFEEFHAAAAAGDPSAMAFLGFMHHGAEGTARDLVKADMWFMLAASLYPVDSQDFHDMLELIDLTETEMSPSERLRADELSYVCEELRYRNCD